MATLSRPAFNSWLGFDNTFDLIDQVLNAQKSIPNWPPYNIKKLDDNRYVIEMAVAGFGKSDLDLTLDGNVLKVSGQADHDAAEQASYLHHGLAERNFTRTFTLADNIEIKNADLINGLLKVWLEYNLPENKKARKIAIGEAFGIPKKFLQE